MTGPEPSGLAAPLRVGRLELDRRLLMAPMAGITTSAFRRSVRRWGAGLVFTEMIAAAGIYHGNRRTFAYLQHRGDEHPLGFQLFGSDPALLAHAADACLQAGADLLDLNLACPVKKVMKTGAGAALLSEPERAVGLVRALVRVAGETPVTVKVRAGLRAGERQGMELAPRLAEAGAAAVCLHPRTAQQLHRGAADHELTRELCGRLPVPVLASGDVTGRDVAERLLGSGAAGVMVARAALGRPWFFAHLLGRPEPAAEERVEELRRFAGEAVSDLDERAVGYLRQFWPCFRRSGVLNRPMAEKLMAARSVAEVEEALAPALGVQDETA